MLRRTQSGSHALNGETIYILEQDHLPVRHGEVADLPERIAGAQAEVFQQLAETMSNSALTPRPVRESASDYSEIALPNDANPLGQSARGARDASGRHCRRAGGCPAFAMPGRNGISRLHDFSPPCSHRATCHTEVGRESGVPNFHGSRCEGVGRGSCARAFAGIPRRPT